MSRFISAPLSALMLGLALSTSARASVLTTLYTFTKHDHVGRLPVNGPYLDASGNLYGETSRGGAFTRGAVFQYSSAGKMQAIYQAPDPIGGAVIMNVTSDGTIYME